MQIPYHFDRRGQFPILSGASPGLVLYKVLKADFVLDVCQNFFRERDSTA